MEKKKVIIIGAGLGGLASAIDLSCKGYEVTVIEKNNKPGGKIDKIKYEDFFIEPGPTCLLNPSVFNDLFAYADEDFNDYVHLQRIDPEWKGFFTDGKKLILFNGHVDTINNNIFLKKMNKNNLDQYFNYSQDIFKLVEEAFFAKGLDTPQEVLSHFGIFKSFRGFDIFSTLNDSILRFFGNYYLQEIMKFFSNYAGSSPYRAPAAFSIYSYLQHRDGLWYPAGGFYNIIIALFQVAKKLKVDFQFNQRVNNLEIEDNTIESVITAEGERYTGDYIVSNMELIPFYQQITDEDDNFMSNFSRFEPSASALIIFLVIKGDYSKLKKHNIFFTKDSREFYRSIFENYNLPADPSIQVTKTDSLINKNYSKDFSTLKITVQVPYIQKNNTSDPEKYNSLKKYIIDKLENMGLNNLNDRIVFQKTFSPSDIASKYLANRGAIYGVVGDKDKNQGTSIPKVSEKYENLYFVGGSVNPGSSIPMVVTGARLVCDRINSDQ
ncbi:MAG: phytoene desaturase family protein [Bacillota bacterium]